MTTVDHPTHEDSVLVEWTIAGEHAAIVERLASFPRNAPVLDLGCGTGAFLERLAKAGFTDLTGVDANPAQFGTTHARFVIADLNRDPLPLPDQHYSLITAIEVVEHLECVGHFLDLVSRHLAPAGTCLLTTPNVHCLHARLRWLLTNRLPAFDEKGEKTHVTPVWLPLFQRMLERRGLAVLDRWTFPPRGSALFRPVVRMAAALLRPVLPDLLPGDVLCLLLGRQGR